MLQSIAGQDLQGVTMSAKRCLEDCDGNAYGYPHEVAPYASSHMPTGSTSDGPMHHSATLTGGTIPSHTPGAYPSLSCCGGTVALVAAEDVGR